jgi:hypothetical protein
MVLTPVNLPEALSNMKEYSMAGFPGCVGSSDCTHIVTDWCEYNLKNKSSWGEEQSDNKDVHSYVQPTPSNIAYIQQTEGLVDGMIDSFIAGIRDGRVLDDVSFELLALDKKGRIKKIRFSGV